MTDSERFEQLKNRIDGLRVKKLAAEKEARRLEEELEDAKRSIRETYGVEITDFAAAIETMRSEYRASLAELEDAVSEAERKMSDAEERR